MNFIENYGVKRMNERGFLLGDFVDVAGIGESSSGRIVAVQDDYCLVMIPDLGVVKALKPFITLKVRVEDHLTVIAKELEKNAV